MNLPDPMQDERVLAAIRTAIEEDVGTGDVTTVALIPPQRRVKARLLAREACVACGGSVAAVVFASLDSRIRFDAVADGTAVPAGGTFATVAGPARGILTGERVALNFLQRLSGVATLTRRFVDVVRPYPCTILDTRKTTPGLRALQKYAVLCGGGANHRMGLYDRILIKDNHRALWRKGRTLDLASAVREARRRFPGIAVEVEVESEEDLRDVLPALPEWVLLDNMDVERMRRCVLLCGGRVKVEASGGIGLHNAAAVAATGVDAISVGALTHSAPAVDLSLEVEGDADDSGQRG